MKAECILLWIGYCLYEGLAVSVEGKDALFLRARVHPLMDWILPYEGLAVSVEGKDALFKGWSASFPWIERTLWRLKCIHRERHIP
ncbi:hypothetical protein [Bartonella sp. CL74QHWL]|uniref:hypothetical protein n=1 Tax=Bartonella sp. CL74QHWL TaxID=3243541 RepID=UPI0035D00FA3